MKNRYLIIIIILILAAFGFEILVFRSRLGEHARLEKAIQSGGIFVALLAAVIALSSMDPKKRKVNVKMEQSVQCEEEHLKSEMSKDLKHAFEGFPDPVRSHRVQFKMTNNSRFTLKKPTITFRVPIQRKHPHKYGKEQIWSRRSFNSNLYNSREELRILEFADTCILSNSNLPYWNQEEDITLWIRMVLDDGKLEPFDVEVSINCENADGFTKRIKINPKGLLKSIATSWLSQESHKQMHAEAEEKAEAPHKKRRD